MKIERVDNNDLFKKELTMKIEDKVRKKSDKPFQNKKRFAIIESFTTMEIPLSNKQEGTKIVEAVFLEGCKGKVRIDMLLRVVKNPYES